MLRFGTSLKKKIAIALIATLIFGFGRVTWEDQIRADLHEADLLEEPPAQSLKDSVVQSSMFALLGGMRPQIAFYFSLSAFDAWRYKDWETVEKNYKIIWAMQPRDVDHRTVGAWHLHTNASADYNNDKSRPLAVRIRKRDEYVEKGIRYLREAAAELPDEAEVWEALGTALREKQRDYCGAADAYYECLKTGNAMGYIRRFYPYFLAKCEGREREAYGILRMLYREGDQQRTPTLIVTIKELEETLGVPFYERIPDLHPDKVREKERQLQNVVPVERWVRSLTSR